MTPSFLIRSRTAALCSALALLPLLARAQEPLTSRVTSTSRLATRTQLDASATQFDQYASSSAYSAGTRARARAEAAAIRRRLSEGDFRIGDLIELRIDAVPGVNDTVTVLEGRRINVRGYRQVSLAGVLRSELESKLQLDLADYIRNTTVSARPMVRVAVFGTVARPGYISVPVEVSLDQVLMLAGGPAATAAVEKTRLMRTDEVILNADEFLAAVASGKTLADLGVLDGDALVVPPGELPWDRNATLQIVSLFLTPLLTIFVLR